MSRLPTERRVDQEPYRTDIGISALNIYLTPGTSVLSMFIEVSKCHTLQCLIDGGA